MRVEQKLLVLEHLQHDALEVLDCHLEADFVHQKYLEVSATGIFVIHFSSEKRVEH